MFTANNNPTPIPDGCGAHPSLEREALLASQKRKTRAEFQQERLDLPQ